MGTDAATPMRVRIGATRFAARPNLLIWVAAGVLACLFALQLLRGSVLYDAWFQDIFIHLNAIRHIEEGSLPHVGFSTPIGGFYYLAFYLTTFFAAPSAYTAVYANGLVAALAAGLAVLAGYRRLHAGWTAALMFYVGLVALSPRHLGEAVITFNAAYNRWSWALFAVLAVVVSLRRDDAENPRAALMDGVLTAVLLVLLFFTKATYAVVGVGLVLASVATVRRGAQTRVYSFTVAAAGALLFVAVELGVGIVLPYLADLRRAASAQASPRVYQLFEAAYVTSADHILILFIAAVAAIASSTKPVVHRVVYLFVLFGAGVAISGQNNPAIEIPLVPVTALIAFHLFGGHAPAVAAPRIVMAAAGAILLLFLKPAVPDALTVVRESLQPAAPGPDVDWLRNTPLRNLAFRPASNRVLSAGDCAGTPPPVEADREYLAVLHDGVRLLKKHPLAGARVLSLTWTNPFPVLIDGPPVRNELSWWDPGRSFDARMHPEPEALLGGVDYVLIPKFEYFAGTPQAMLGIYGDEIRARYRLLDESGCWRLMGAAGRS
ncbi:MAG: hypothetical protein KY444_00465 [Gemmatimonadetes bacterium]|nr:hypothetical protein [Gemmatimonadota bacterium]